MRDCKHYLASLVLHRFLIQISCLALHQTYDNNKLFCSRSMLSSSDSKMLAPYLVKLYLDLKCIGNEFTDLIGMNDF